MPIPGMGAFAAQAKKKLGAGAPPTKGGPPGGNKPDGIHPHTSGMPGTMAGPQDIQRVAAEQVARVQAGKVDPQLVKLMHGFDPGMGYPQWAIDEQKWAQAEGAVQPDAAGQHLPDPYLVIAHVYKAIGGRINPGAQVTDGHDPSMGADPNMGQDPSMGGGAGGGMGHGGMGHGGMGGGGFGAGGF